MSNPIWAQKWKKVKGRDKVPGKTSFPAAALKALKEQFAAAAQKVYDEWEQDDSGHDNVYNTGGICDAIADAIMDVIAENVPNVNCDIGGQDGDDHSWVLVTTRNGWQIGVDIDPSVYERGSGYVWAKRDGVEFIPSDIQIFTIGYSPKD